VKRYENEEQITEKKKWRNCGWSETQQQHSKRETKRTVI
jgi:hypothetical protein